MPLSKPAQTLKRALPHGLTTEERINSLRELTELEHKRVELESSLSEIHFRIDALQTDLFRTLRRPLRNRLQENARHGRRNSRRRMARGELRAEIFSRMEIAGSRGVKVHEIANDLGVKPVNIHSWFHSAVKRFPEIRKAGPSHYQLLAHLPQSNIEDALFGTAAVSAPEYAPEMRRRGEVTERILRVLEAAGPEGVSVREIAARTDSSYRRVHVWISSTGKRNGWVKRIARGTYGLHESTVPTHASAQ